MESAGHGSNIVATEAVAIAALRTMSENLGQGLILTDTHGQIVTINHLAELTTGWSSHQLLGHQCRRFLRCLDANALQQYRTSCHSTSLVRNGETVHRLLRSASGRRLPVKAKSTQVFAPDGTLLGTLCTFSPEHHDLLLDHSAAEFLSNVSHELRTPLSSLATSIELLSSSYLHMPKQDIARVLQVVHHSTLRLHNLVENLLSASSIQLGCFHIQPHHSDLAEIIDAAASFVQPILDKKHQQLRKQLPALLPAVMVDARRIMQVIVNLLSNASKYGPPGDEITLSVGRRARYLLTSVREHGPGIAPEEQSSIFERFYRSKNNGLHEPRGVGLGLALVKSIVTAHGGRVGVQSEPGAGSTFWLTLPVLDPASSQPNTRETRRESADR